jgi:FtsP/CotA-like multicopper oxidase with cupredoxin domain
MDARPRIVLPALLAGLALLPAACSGSGPTPGGGGAGERAAAEPASISVSLLDFAIQPSTLQAPAGAALTFEVHNAGATPHTFAVIARGTTQETGAIPAGDHATLSLPPLEAGSYDLLCTVPGHDTLGMTGTLEVTGDAAVDATGTPGGVAHSSMTAEEMAAGHEAGVKAFLAGKETEVHGNRPLEPTIVDGVKVFELRVTNAWWEVSRGEIKQALAYNGQIPGPELRVEPGDRVRIVVDNSSSQPTALHLHGVTLPNEMDGVPYVTQPPIMPGESFEYELRITDPPGMYVYHSHFNSAEQVGMGLYGALIVEPKTGSWRSAYGVEPDAEYSIFLGDGPLGFVLNGKSFPATLPLVAHRGEHVLIHLANDGELLHPMHMHGFHFQVVGEDGFPLSPQNRYMADTLVVAPGSRYDIIVKADQPGAWAFHCHILSHVEGPQGMYGMVTALVVE